MKSLNDSSDEEIERILRKAMLSMDNRTVSDFDAFCSALNMAGLSYIIDSIKISKWAFDRINNLWQDIVNDHSDNQSTYNTVWKEDRSNWGRKDGW